MAVSKRVKLDVNVLLEWIYDDNNTKTENYAVISNLNEGTRGYVSTIPLNTMDNTLFTVDSVLKRYSKVDLDKFNFLQKQDYAGTPIAYDKIKLYFPVDYNFPSYVGFNFKVYSLDYINKNIYNLCNYYYDKALDANIGTLELITPFNFNEKYWGKCVTIEIPSIFNISKDRVVTSTVNYPIPNSINSNLTNGVGLSQTAPIYIDFSFISTSDVVLGSTYYTLSDTYETAVPQQPEYQSLGVEIVESTQGDFFEIYGIYQGTNELLDDFVADLEAKGKKIEIEYQVTLYEEGIQSGYPQTFVVTENFAQKILYRPIIRFSNTTAALDVIMYIKNLVDNSEIERFASIGLTKNIFKYGKTLSRINIDSGVIKPKIYKASPENITISGSANVTEVKTNLTKVPYPVLHDKYQILVNSTNSINTDYKSNGLLEIIITPFDTVIKFTIAKSINTTTNEPIPYDITEISSNASLKLVFKSESKTLEKEYYAQSNENSFKLGIIIYKINETDLGVIKEIYNKGYKNFYLTLVANNNKTLLYSGKYEFYENAKFVDLQTAANNEIINPYVQKIDTLEYTIKQMEIDKKALENSQFNRINIPYGISEDLIKDNKKFFNLLIFLRRTTNVAQFNEILATYDIKDYIYNDYTYYIGGLNILIIQKLENLSSYITKTIRIDIYDGQNEESKVYTIPNDTTDIAITTIKTKHPIDTTTTRRGGGGGSCFTPESLVLTSDGSYQMIKDVKVGDGVMSYHMVELPEYENLETWSSVGFGGYTTSSLVNDVLVHDIQSGYYNINGDLLQVTPEHMIFVLSNNLYQFKSAENVEIGDYLYNSDNSFIKVISKEFVEYTGKVYNLTLDSNFVYYVNGILVHNVKKRTRDDNYTNRRDEQY